MDSCLLTILTTPRFLHHEEIDQFVSISSDCSFSCLFQRITSCCVPASTHTGHQPSFLMTEPNCPPSCLTFPQLHNPLDSVGLLLLRGSSATVTGEAPSSDCTVLSDPSRFLEVFLPNIISCGYLTQLRKGSGCFLDQ